MSSLYCRKCLSPGCSTSSIWDGERLSCLFLFTLEGKIVANIKHHGVYQGLWCWVSQQPFFPQHILVCFWKCLRLLLYRPCSWSPFISESNVPWNSLNYRFLKKSKTCCSDHLRCLVIPVQIWWSVLGGYTSPFCFRISNTNLIIQCCNSSLVMAVSSLTSAPVVVVLFFLLISNTLVQYFVSCSVFGGAKRAEGM